MLNQGTINYRAVIEKMQRDTGFTQFYEDECKEWLWEVMSLIGLNSLLVNTQTDIIIEDYRGLLPNNVETILAVKDQVTGVAIIKDLGVFSKQLRTVDTNNITRVISDGVSYTSVDGTIIPELSHTMVDIIRPAAPNYGSPRYKIQGQYIYIDGINNGTITIAYTAFPIEDTAPVIPNDAKILEMCSWYIATKIAMRLLIRGEIQSGIMDKIEQQYLFYVKSARLKALTPDYAMMESMKMRMGLIPDTNRYSNGFTNKY